MTDRFEAAASAVQCTTLALSALLTDTTDDWFRVASKFPDEVVECFGYWDSVRYDWPTSLVELGWVSHKSVMQAALNLLDDIARQVQISSNRSDLIEMLETKYNYRLDENASCKLCDKIKYGIQLELGNCRKAVPLAIDAYPRRRQYEKDRFVWESITSMSCRQLILEIEKRKKPHGWKPIKTEAGFRKAALAFSQFHRLPTRNFEGETPYVPTEPN